MAGGMLSDLASTFCCSSLQQTVASKSPINVIRSILRDHPESILKRDFSRGLPLHIAAAYNAPADVVRLLVDRYRQAVEEPDCLGYLPLHYAAQLHESVEVVKLLVAACPRTMFVKESKGKRPVDVCPKRKNRAIAAYLKQAMIDYNKMPTKPALVVPAVEQQQQQQQLAAIESAPSEIDLDDHVPFAPPFGESLGPPTYADDRDRVRKAVEQPNHEPALVSVAYVESIKTQTFLGDGFFGTVFKGSDPILGRDFAIKSINTEILRGGAHQELKDAMKTFKTEQEVSNRLSAFPPFDLLFRNV
jgi:Ankyrin repeats (3 copies)